LVGRAASLNDEQIVELSKLNKGVAAVYQNDWLEPVLCKVNKNMNEEEIYTINKVTEGTKKDVKGDIISRIVAKDIYRLVDCADDVINADISAPAKCKLYEYIEAPDAQKLDIVAAITYELFSAEDVFAALAKNGDWRPVIFLWVFIAAGGAVICFLLTNAWNKYKKL
jgi:hypothetical protein